ncbi:MAG: ROK family transcriptional regulator [Lachnospiraceae bacterium]|jgi:predicted NBD/HSP70 family sugar kinase|nr:ROK family transcriptional regulator [Lachnospiraceae bacterium]
MKAISSADMKQINRKTVFDLARKKRQVTRGELSEMTGLSGPSIMAIVNEFMGKGILTDTGKQNGSLGRSPLTYAFNPDCMLSIGIEFEGNGLSVGLVNLDGKIRFQTVSRIPSDLGADFFHILDDSIDKINGMAEQKHLSYNGIGIGIPGAVSSESKIVYFAPFVGIYDAVDISAPINKLADHYKKSVFIENDVNCSAVGEYYIGNSKDVSEDLLYISVGSGIGAGIILNGQLRRGKRDLCGEIGYLLKDIREPVSRKQTGWLERHLSYEYLCEHFENYKQNGTISPEMQDYVVQTLSPFAANIINTLDLDNVVIGGQLMEKGGGKMIRALSDAISRLSLSQIRISGCRTEYVGVIGSALLASDKLWSTIL